MVSEMSMASFTTTNAQTTNHIIPVVDWWLLPSSLLKTVEGPIEEEGLVEKDYVPEEPKTGEEKEGINDLYVHNISNYHTGEKLKRHH